MRNKIILLSFLLLGVSPLYAISPNLSARVERLVMQQQAQHPYYADKQTAELCQQWPSCVKWATQQYTQEKNFKIVKARLKTQHCVYRHHTRMETYLYVQAISVDKTINLLFTSPQTSRRGKPYQLIANFPAD